MKKHLFFLVFFFSYYSGFSQDNYVPGFIVRSGGEKINGYIDNRQWTKNPRKISFRTSDREEPAAFTPETLESFEINGGDRYVSAKIVKDMRPVKVRDITIVNSEQLENDHVFLRELFSNSSIGLYMLTDFKNHFYVRESDGDFVELIYQVRLTTQTDQVEEQNIFRNQLQMYFPNEKESALLASVKYTESSLTRLFYKLTKTPQKAIPKSKPIFRAGLGVALSKLEVSGNSKLSDHDFKLSVRPLVYAGVDLPVKRTRGGLVIRAFAEYYQLNYESFYIRPYPFDGFEEKYELAMHNFKIASGLQYNIFNKQKTKVYVGGDVAANIVSYTKNKFYWKDIAYGQQGEEVLYEFEKSWFTLNATAGCILFSKLELTLSSRLAGSFSEIKNINVKPSQYLFRLGYRF